MARKKQTGKKHIKIHRLSYILVLAVIVAVGAFGAYKLIENWNEDRRQAQHQESIQDFYEPPTQLPDKPGQLIRSEKMNINVPNGGTAYRVLYVTETPGGGTATTSGMVFVPPGEAPESGRKVIAWAHGTLGVGDRCTPSRSLDDPSNDMENWLDGAMQRGYVVAATDYVGIGTPGSQYYLIGESEANDVINSVRAARSMPEASAGKDYVVWGHSQGGHSALFTGIRAESYAPELTLRGVAAAAPAAELVPLFTQQYDTPIAWGIGPDTVLSWAEVYPDLPVDDVLTGDASKNYERLANDCIRQPSLSLIVRAALKAKFFSTNPLQFKQWEQAIKEQTPKIENINVPIYIAQGLSDQVVLPNTTALLAKKACDVDKNLELDWLGNMDHALTAITAGPNFMAWAQDRFASFTPPSSCSQPLPIKPAGD